jgi:hypothetical protein
VLRQFCEPPTTSTVPVERLIGPLRCRTAESGFRNVYRHRIDPAGNPVWVARVKLGGCLYNIPGSRSTQPHVTARFVARWYAETFGDNWRAVLATRKINPFQIRESKRFGGFIAAVWVIGNREEVVVMQRLKRNRWRPTEKIAVFETREDARRGIRRYLLLRYGLFASVVAWKGENNRGQAEASPLCGASRLTIPKHATTRLT